MKCQDFLLNKVVPEHGPRFDVFIGGCGPCRTRVPCSRRIPEKSDP